MRVHIIFHNEQLLFQALFVLEVSFYCKQSLNYNPSSNQNCIILSIDFKSFLYLWFIKNNKLPEQGQWDPIVLHLCILRSSLCIEYLLWHKLFPLTKLKIRSHFDILQRLEFNFYQEFLHTVLCHQLLRTNFYSF